ncbi:hypothetical protein N431DRAFT_433693 [Stipitochalara longipes BDJ]|nr:hypothetical protein N431DRAFT_433693 [Stipitochalara longipes BDJ]
METPQQVLYRIYLKILLTSSQQLWCWYSNDYMMTRLYAYYIPIWVVVTLAMLLYILVGLKIHRNNVLLSSLQSPPLSTPSTRTFEHKVSYSLAPERWSIPGENTPITNTTTIPSTSTSTSTSITISAPPSPTRLAITHSFLTAFLHLFSPPTAAPRPTAAWPSSSSPATS